MGEQVPHGEDQEADPRWERAMAVASRRRLADHHPGKIDEEGA